MDLGERASTEASDTTKAIAMTPQPSSNMSDV